MLELAFDGQMHFGCFYAYVKLKEQVGSCDYEFDVLMTKGGGCRLAYCTITSIPVVSRFYFCPDHQPLLIY